MSDETTTITEPDPFATVPEAEDRPPRKAARKRTTKKPTATQIRKNLDALWVTAGGITMGFDPYCGAVLVTRGPGVTDALMELSKQNPRVRQALEALATTSAWGGVAVAVAGVVAPILAHHKVIPAEIGMMVGPSSEELDAAGVDSDAVLRQLLGLEDDDSQGDSSDVPDVG